VLVGLHAVGQPHPDERGLMPLRAQLLAGELAQPAGQGAVLAATDPEHVAFGRGRPQVVLEEVDSLPDFDFGGNGRLDAKFGEDPLP